MLTPILIVSGSVLAGIIVSCVARLFELKGLQIWLPASIILAIGWSPIIGFLVAAAVLLVSFAIKPYPPATLAIMLLLLFGTLQSIQLFAITQSNFVLIAMILTTVYVIVTNIVLSFIHPDFKSVILFIVFTIPISWIIYAQLGWSIISVL